MPYVEVWVDEEECDGDCEAASEVKILQARIDEAERLLRMGSVDAALRALTDDSEDLPRPPADMAARYRSWQEGRLDGFIPPEQNRAGT